MQSGVPKVLMAIIHPLNRLTDLRVEICCLFKFKVVLMCIKNIHANYLRRVHLSHKKLFITVSWIRKAVKLFNFELYTSLLSILIQINCSKNH